MCCNKTGKKTNKGTIFITNTSSSFKESVSPIKCDQNTNLLELVSTKELTNRESLQTIRRAPYTYVLEDFPSSKESLTPTSSAL